MISCVVPVSPSRGKMRVTLWACAPGFRSVMASTAKATLNPSSYAWRGRFDPDARGAAREADRRAPAPWPGRGEVRAGERAPRLLGHQVVLGLPVQLGGEIGESFRERSARAGLFRAARRAAGHVDEHDRQAVTAEGVRQRAGELLKRLADS